MEADGVFDLAELSAAAAAAEEEAPANGVAVAESNLGEGELPLWLTLDWRRWAVGVGSEILTVLLELESRFGTEDWEYWS